MKAPAPALDFTRWIVWEDDGLLAVDKPAGVLSQGGEGGAGINVVDLARAYLAQRDVGVLHRLDRNVSGLVLVSKHARSARAMSALFASGAVTRVYRAVVCGTIPSPQFAIDAWLAKDAAKNQVHACSEASLASLVPSVRALYRPARTEGKLIRRFRAPLGACAVLELRPITGRSHQLRVHLAHVGAPIVGDPKYGVAAHDVNRPLLHAARLEFVHPSTGTALILESAVPWTDAQLAHLRHPTRARPSDRRPPPPRRRARPRH